jgi:hypothetical protein
LSEDVGRVGCERCADLRAPFPITSDAALRNAIRVVHDNLKDKTLVEVHYAPGAVVPLRPSKFAYLQPDGPWDDFLAYYFACTACGQPYRLSAETYHGSGGSWEPVLRI